MVDTGLINHGWQYINIDDGWQGHRGGPHNAILPNAVGLLNPGSEPAKVMVDWSALGLKGKQKVRDLWRQKDLGIHSEKFTAEVRPHGVVLVRLTPTAALENRTVD
jgi:hypothetical protein